MNSLKEELRKWFPRNFEQWILVLVCLLILTASTLMFAAKTTQSNIPYFMRNQFVVIYDFTPLRVESNTGRPIRVSYLYIKKDNCIGSVTYHVRELNENEDVVSVRTLGPYVSGWPSTINRTWITQEFPSEISNLPSGSYALFWQVIGTCGVSDAYTRGPITYLSMSN